MNWAEIPYEIRLLVVEELRKMHQIEHLAGNEARYTAYWLGRPTDWVAIRRRMRDHREHIKMECLLLYCKPH